MKGKTISMLQLFSFKNRNSSNLNWIVQLKLHLFSAFWSIHSFAWHFPCVLRYQFWKKIIITKKLLINESQKINQTFKIPTTHPQPPPRLLSHSPPKEKRRHIKLFIFHLFHTSFLTHKSHSFFSLLSQKSYINLSYAIAR